MPSARHYPSPPSGFRSGVASAKDPDITSHTVLVPFPGPGGLCGARHRPPDDTATKRNGSVLGAVSVICPLGRLPGQGGAARWLLCDEVLNNYLWNEEMNERGNAFSAQNTPTWQVVAVGGTEEGGRGSLARGEPGACEGAVKTWGRGSEGWGPRRPGLVLGGQLPVASSAARRGRSSGRAGLPPARPPARDSGGLPGLTSPQCEHQGSPCSWNTHLPGAGRSLALPPLPTRPLSLALPARPPGIGSG